MRYTCVKLRSLSAGTGGSQALLVQYFQPSACERRNSFSLHDALSAFRAGISCFMHSTRHSRGPLVKVFCSALSMHALCHLASLPLTQPVFPLGRKRPPPHRAGKAVGLRRQPSKPNGPRCNRAHTCLSIGSQSLSRPPRSSCARRGVCIRAFAARVSLDAPSHMLPCAALYVTGGPECLLRPVAVSRHARPCRCNATYGARRVVISHAWVVDAPRTSPERSCGYFVRT